MQKCRVFCLLSFVFLLLFSCGGPGSATGPESSVKGGITWNDDLPIANFPTAAGTADLIDYRQVNWGEGDNGNLGVTITSLMAIVNAEQPRIVIGADGNDSSSRAASVLDKLGISYRVIHDPFALFSKYDSYITKAVIWREDIPDTLNLASTYAGLNKAIVLTGSDYQKLKEHGIEPEIIMDYSKMFDEVAGKGASEQRLAVYGYMYDNLYADCTRRIVTSQPPGYNVDPDIKDPVIKVKLRDYSMAVGSAIIWLDFANSTELALADKFFSQARPGNSVVMGWGMNGNEGGLVTAASLNGMYVWASDHSESLTFYAAGRGKTPVLPVKSVDEFLDPQGKVKPAVYVAIGVSDGDNLQYVQGLLFDMFGEDRHRDPDMPALSWTMNPAASEVIPAVYNWFIQKQATDYPKDGFLTGPSGIGYFYPLQMYNKTGHYDMLKFFRQTSRYLAKTGINTISCWYTGVGDPNVPDNFLKDIAPALDGVTAMIFQGNNRPMREYEGVVFTGWNAPYDDTSIPTVFARNIKEAFDRFASDDSKAGYVSLQGNPGGTDLYRDVLAVRHASDALVSGDKNGRDVIKYVTIDQLMQLQRIEMGLDPINRG